MQKKKICLRTVCSTGLRYRMVITTVFRVRGVRSPGKSRFLTGSAQYVF